MLVVRRTRVHSPLLAGVLGTAMLLCGIGVAIVGLVDAAVDDGARAVAAQHAGVDLALRVSLDLAEDPERQDSQVRAALARSLVGLSAPWSVDRTVAGEVRLTSPGRDGSTEERAVTAVSIGDLAGRVDLVAGSWAADDADVVVQADAADELGLRPGDEILLDDVPLHVAGTWRVRDHLDPRWLGDPQVTTGKADGQLGPMVVAASRWPEMLEVPRARWVLVPDLDDVTAADLEAVARARDDLQTDWTGRVDDVDSLDVDGRLVDVAHEVALRTDGLRAGEPVVLLLLAAVGLVTLAALARLFASTHGQELALLWARGASTGSLAGSAAVETSVAAAAGGTVGALVAGAAVFVAQEPARPTAITLAGIVTVLAVTASAAGLTALQVRLATTNTRTWRGPGGRAGRLVGPGLVTLVAAAAALSVWQLREYGSPVTVRSDGTPAVDPVAVAAPAALLVAVVLAALTLFPLVAGRAERRSRGDDVTRLLAARHLSRRLVPVTAPVLAVAIAAATLVAAATYSGTWTSGFDTTRQLRAGADVRVSTDQPGPDVATLDAVAALPDVDAVAPVATQLGGDIGSLVAVTPAALDTLADGFADRAERERAAAALTSRTSAPELPAGTNRIGVTLEAAGLARPPEVTVQVADPSGVVREVRLETTREDRSGTTSFSASLPVDPSGVPGPRTVVGMDVEVAWRAPRADVTPRVGLVAIHATGEQGEVTLADETWTAQVPGDRELTIVPGRLAPGGDVVVDPDVRTVRLSPSFAPGSPDGPRLPVILSATAAGRLDLDVGDVLEIPLDGTYARLRTRVTAVVPAVPGAPDESAVLIDLHAVHQALLHDQEVVAPPTDLWVGSADPESAADSLRHLLPANARIDTAADAAGRTVLATAVLAWWLGALGCGLLALLTLVTVGRGQLRSRRGDIAILRALGLTVREQQVLRGRELAWTTVFGLAAGITAGVAVALLVVPQLARAAVPEPYPTIATGLGVHTPALLLGAVALVGALALGVVGYAWRVGVEARSTGGPVGDR